MFLVLLSLATNHWHVWSRWTQSTNPSVAKLDEPELEAGKDSGFAKSDQLSPESKDEQLDADSLVDRVRGGGGGGNGTLRGAANAALLQQIDRLREEIGGLREENDELRKVTLQSWSYAQ